MLGGLKAKQSYGMKPADTTMQMNDPSQSNRFDRCGILLAAAAKPDFKDTYSDAVSKIQWCMQGKNITDPPTSLSWGQKPL